MEIENGDEGNDGYEKGQGARKGEEGSPFSLSEGRSPAFREVPPFDKGRLRGDEMFFPERKSVTFFTPNPSSASAGSCPGGAPYPRPLSPS